jgi:hypothetical protein
VQEISCQMCGNSVAVERNTDNQVCVQWAGDAEGLCIEFARRARRGERSAEIRSCSALKATIELNILNGVIRITTRSQPAPFPAARKMLP